MKKSNEKKLDIIFLDFDDRKNPLLNGGQAKATFEVASRLIKKGHHVTVVSSKFPESKTRLENGIRYLHVGVGSKNIKINNFMYILLLPFTVMRLKGDIIVECFTAPMSTLLSPLFTKIPVVAVPTSFDAQRFSALYHFPFTGIERYGSKVYKYFIAFTPFLAKKMKAYNSNISIREIPQGVGKEYFSIKSNTSAYILFIGRLDMHQKGLDLLLRSYAQISNIITLPLIIAGEGADRVKIEALITKLGLSKQVTLYGFANDKQKQSLFSSAAFIAFPSRNEGFSLVSLESIASGHRLVSFDIPSLAWAPKEIARKVKPFSVSLYAQALLSESQHMRTKAIESTCKEFAKKYSWDNVANEFEAFFQDIKKGQAL